MELWCTRCIDYLIELEQSILWLIFGILIQQSRSDDD